MNKIIILGLVLLTLVGCEKTPPPPLTPAAIEKAPEFTLKDMNGKEIKLAELIGPKPIVLDFWEAWCSACRDEIMKLSEIHNQHKDKITIIGINLDRSPKDAESFIRKNFVPYPNLYDQDSQTARAYRVPGVPHLVIINAKGEIAKRNATLADVKALVK